MNERWLPVAGYEGGYEVSSFGRIRHAQTKRVRKLCATRGGYASVNLYLPDRQPRVRTHRVNVLVLSAFRAPRPEGLDAAHIDGDRTNNKLSNLRWKTKAANEADKREHGTLLHGEKAPWAKMTAADVKTIRASHAAGESWASIARRMKLGYQAVYDAGTGRRWQHA